MSEKKIIICLANSKKHNDRCVAGVEWVDDRPGNWVRPVSARDGHAVSFTERQLPDGVDPAPRDILEIPLLTAQARDFQTENWLLDPNNSWSKTGVWPWDDLGRLEDTPIDLWGTDDSSGKGKSDRVSEASAMDLTNSLALVRVNALVLHVLDGGFQQIAREVRAEFEYRGVTYNLRVSDPTYVQSYLDRDDGTYDLSVCYLTVSLTEPFNGSCYKVIAAVLEPGGTPEETG